MGRPKLDTPRIRQLNIGLTEDEHQSVMQRAARMGMRPVDFARARLFSGRTSDATAAATRSGHLDSLFLNHLSRIGSNLNQIARSLHMLQMPSPSDLEPLLRELRAILRNHAQP